MRRGLSTLPAPRNDYEIVVPEDEMEVDPSAAVDGSEDGATYTKVEDQADIDARIEADRKSKLEKELKRRSQSLQRGLPRPQEVNNTILRPSHSSDASLTDLQRAEELIKKEMLCMMHYDSLNDPAAAAAAAAAAEAGAQKAPLSRKAIEASQSFLAQHPYRQFDDADLENAKQLLRAEMDKVKVAMGHGDLTHDAYTQVWDECLSQVLFVPSQNRYTRASLASKKDRLECMERRLETNRNHMTREARKAGKLEKKLRTLTAGYQSRSQALVKQAQEVLEQIEAARLELDTYAFLKKHEDGTHIDLVLHFFLLE